MQAAPSTAARPPDSLSAESFRRLARVITDRLGIKMPPEKASMLEGRLRRRVHRMGLSGPDEYEHRLLSLPDSDPEWMEFVNLVTTNKTDFFRESAHFEHLAKRVLPGLGAGEHRIWCCGCSSGEEPYTLAMVLEEHRSGRPGFEYSILATDISTRVLKMAGEAVYPAERVEPVPDALKRKYLLRSRDLARKLVRVGPELRRRVRFSRLNLMDGDYGIRQSFPVIFFRNVMIYFDRPTQQRVLERLCAHLVPGGRLFTGHSESLAGFNLPLATESAAVYRKTR